MAAKTLYLQKTKYSVTRGNASGIGSSIDRNSHKTIRKRILEAGAIASYHQMTNIPVVTTLLSDDAPQSSNLRLNMLFVGSMTRETTRSYEQ